MQDRVTPGPQLSQMTYHALKTTHCVLEYVELDCCKFVLFSIEQYCFHYMDMKERVCIYLMSLLLPEQLSEEHPMV